MNVNNVSGNNIYTSTASVNSQEQKGSAVSSSYAQNPIATSFKANMPPQQSQTQSPAIPATPNNIRTQFATKEEQDKFIQVAMNLDKQGKQSLELLLKSGILLSNKSNDKSTTLDSLYKMVSTPRLQGLTPQTVLAETVNTIANPFVITQSFGDIPKEYMNQIVQQAKPNPKTPGDKIDSKTIDVRNSSACVSASIEFNLAMKMPAEFARFAEGLTSPKMSVDKTINLKNLTDNTLDSIYLLNMFEIPYKADNFDKATLTLAPDKNSYIRAQIQNSNKDHLERSLVDVLMQSTFMNVGSQGTYDSLTDIRGGKFNEDNKGLIEFEKTFTESIVQDKNKMSVTYQILDENAKLTGYTADFSKITRQILESLAIGENVIIGYTQLDENRKVINGHEITIIGATKDKEGNLIFICNDTDDNKPVPIIYKANDLIPQIHHAGLPQEVVAKEEGYSETETWKEGLKAYKESKKAEKAA